MKRADLFDLIVLRFVFSGTKPVTISSANSFCTFKPFILRSGEFLVLKFLFGYKLLFGPNTYYTSSQINHELVRIGELVHNIHCHH